MNSRNYGVPQNRDRTFMVSIYDPYEEYTFEFPKPIELEHLMVDYLDDVVDEKFYLENERKDKMIENLILEGKLPDPETATLEDLAKAFDIPVDKLIWCFGSEDLRGWTTTDLSYTDTRLGVDVANTLSRRQDRGVSARRQEGTGVLSYEFKEDGTCPT